MCYLVIMDWHSRAVVGWSLSNIMEAFRVLETLNFAMERFGYLINHEL
jgi:transposase InsO family protein